MFSAVVQDVIKHFVTKICEGAYFLHLMFFAAVSPCCCVFVWDQAVCVRLLCVAIAVECVRLDTA
jgi:hypothetical protein